MNLNPYNLILGSKSPRRAFLLDQAGITYTKHVIETDESYPEGLPVVEIAEHISNNKVLAFVGKVNMSDIVLCADTIVVYGGQVYGKPKDKEDALNTILKLSNNIHQVYTGVSIMKDNSTYSFSEMSKVKFGKISKDEAIEYIENFSPYDKAGSYGIQDWIGFARIDWIEGSYSNILGLPLSQTYDKLKELVGA